MKKLLLSTLTGVVFMTTASNLGATPPSSSGGVSMTCTVVPSISLTFISDASGVTLTNSGTSSATLPFGSVSAYGYSAPSTITQVVNASGSSATAFSVATPFDVLVMEANSTSTTYTLTAELANADSTNSWYIDGNAVASSGTTSVTTTGSYGSQTSHTLLLSIPFSATAGLISNSVNFVATAN